MMDVRDVMVAVLAAATVLVFSACDFGAAESESGGCAAGVDRVHLAPAFAALGGYKEHQKIRFINADSVDYDMQVAEASQGFDESQCPTIVLYEDRRVVLEGPNPLLSMGMNLRAEYNSEASVSILIGAYSFGFHLESEKSFCHTLGQDSLYARKKFCINAFSCSKGDCGDGGRVFHLDTLRIDGTLYKDVFKVKHNVYSSNRDNIYFSAEKGLLRFEKDDGSFIEIREKKGGRGK